MQTRKRSAKDFAIEHGGYLATDIEAYLKAVSYNRLLIESKESDSNKLQEAKEILNNRLIVLEISIYNFRKRAEQAGFKV